MAGKLVVRLDWRLATVVIVAIIAVAAVLVSLILTRQIPAEVLQYFFSWLIGIAMGGSVPVIRYWREKPLKVETDSDPPEGAAS
jgi:uncharacterized membrane protein YfcA